MVVRESVSIKPRDACNTVLKYPADAPLEHVVESYFDRERERDDDKGLREEAEVRPHVRSAPCELMSSLPILAKRMGVPVPVLQRCMVHSYLDWYERILGIDTLCAEFSRVYEDIKLSGHMSSLRRQTDTRNNFQYCFAPEPVETHVSSIKWVMSRLADYGKLFKATSLQLHLMGMVRSITTLQHVEWDLGSIEQYFLPEVRNFTLLVEEARIDCSALRAKFDLRLASLSPKSGI